MGGGSSETPELYYVIYEQPLIIIILIRVQKGASIYKAEVFPEKWETDLELFRKRARV